MLMDVPRRGNLSTVIDTHLLLCSLLLHGPSHTNPAQNDLHRTTIIDTVLNPKTPSFAICSTAANTGGVIEGLDNQARVEAMKKY